MSKPNSPEKSPVNSKAVKWAELIKEDTEHSEALQFVLYCMEKTRGQNRDSRLEHVNRELLSRYNMFLVVHPDTVYKYDKRLQNGNTAQSIRASTAGGMDACIPWYLYL